MTTLVYQHPALGGGLEDLYLMQREKLSRNFKAIPFVLKAKPDLCPTFKSRVSVGKGEGGAIDLHYPAAGEYDIAKISQQYPFIRTKCQQQLIKN
jgi:hypothetical protein